MTVPRRRLGRVAIGALALTTVLAACAGDDDDRAAKGSTTTAKPDAAPTDAGVEKNLIFYTDDGATSAKTVTFHIYDLSTMDPIASVCIKVPDIGLLAVPDDVRGKTPDIFLGVTENSVLCNDPDLQEKESQGTPDPDAKYTERCRSLRHDHGEIVRFPDGFTATNPPSCELSEPTQGEAPTAATKAKDLVFYTDDATSQAKTVTFHLYDLETKRPLASICIKVPDVGLLPVPSDVRDERADLFVGATENSVDCNDPALQANEARGTPDADAKYETKCHSLRSTHGEVVRLDSLTGTKPPDCEPTK